MTDTIYTTSPNPVALVTGGSRGLGRSTVQSLAWRGIRSIFTYHSNRAQADEVVAEVAANGAQAIALPLDVGNVSTFEAFSAEVRAALSSLGTDKLDFLVNNAGISHHNAIATTTEQELDSLYNVHFKGVFFLTQTLLPILRDGGRIVNISSGLTRITLPNSAPYASMKGAVEVLTRYLAVELGKRGIAANTVAPGAIQTDFSGGAVRDNPELNRFVASNTALGRAGLPDDIGPLIASLLAEDNRWINAQRIEASGGMFL
ncbi:3-oxoacyl-ACP reductase [Pandoraea vervacti]|uniref:3-oxoacyl-ACP reductase n=1 Tax=Pandoraea vervacti TaxID=656178 RepID=A0ABM5T466_9BURK|nr:SDR family oxidoreductase [Pandoraea vervacti]AJP59747.2 3-oxoacyl-ACP reductase [Pandoraea vervacti]